jgi:hypothetical protein
MTGVFALADDAQQPWLHWWRRHAAAKQSGLQLQDWCKGRAAV